MQAIQTATRNAAKILRMDDVIGTIEEGKTADLLLVKNNPLESLDALLEVERVFLSGNEVRRDLLIK
jgi:imidazolonepropionase-like amidohydrolase